MSKAKENSKIMVIPDLHIPYEHPSHLEFLKAVKKKYKPNKIIQLGDELDKHALSFHDSDADLFSAGDELQASIVKLQALEKVFPKMILLDSNHGSLAVRKFKHHGIPIKYLKSQQDIYEVGYGWQWENDLTLTLPNGQDVYFCHGISKNGLKVAAQRGTNVVQGHFHSDFNIQYIGNPANLLWSLQSGCLIDKKSLAFAYDKLNLNRPILGCSMIIDSQPLLIPMVLDVNGKWIGKL